MAWNDDDRTDPGMSIPPAAPQAGGQQAGGPQTGSPVGGYSTPNPTYPQPNTGAYPAQQPAQPVARQPTGGYPQQPAYHTGGYPAQQSFPTGGYPQQQPQPSYPTGGFPQQQPFQPNPTGGYPVQPPFQPNPTGGYPVQPPFQPNPTGGYPVQQPAQSGFQTGGYPQQGPQGQQGDPQPNHTPQYGIPHQPHPTGGFPAQQPGFTTGGVPVLQAPKIAVEEDAKASRVVFGISGMAFGGIFGTLLGIINAKLEGIPIVEGTDLILNFGIWSAFAVGMLAFAVPDRFATGLQRLMPEKPEE